MSLEEIRDEIRDEIREIIDPIRTNCRNIASNAEVVKHNETGFVFSNVEEFIDLALHLLKDKETRQKLAENARILSETMYLPERESQGYLSLVDHFESFH